MPAVGATATRRLVALAQHISAALTGSDVPQPTRWARSMLQRVHLALSVRLAVDVGLWPTRAHAPDLALAVMPPAAYAVWVTALVHRLKRAAHPDLPVCHAAGGGHAASHTGGLAGDGGGTWPPYPRPGRRVWPPSAGGSCGWCPPAVDERAPCAAVSLAGAGDGQRTLRGSTAGPLLTMAALPCFAVPPGGQLVGGSGADDSRLRAAPWLFLHEAATASCSSERVGCFLVTSGRRHSLGASRWWWPVGPNRSNPLRCRGLSPRGPVVPGVRGSTTRHTHAGERGLHGDSVPIQDDSSPPRYS
jgi:hypothetical protein